MAINYIDPNDYTINFFANAKRDYVATIPSSSTTQSITYQTLTHSVLNNYNWAQSTGSLYNEWTYATGSLKISDLNPNGGGAGAVELGYSQVGTRVYIRGDEIYTNVYRNSSTENDNGIVIFKSSSLGWNIKDYINVPTSSVSNGNAAGVAREFSLHKNYITVGVLDTNNDDSKLFVYRSSSSGWAVDQILTTASYNAGAAVNDNNGDYAFLCAKIHGNKIFTNGFRNNSNRYVAFFNSSSAAGWTLEKEVQVEAVSSDTNASMGISGVALDFDGTTAVMGSKDGSGSESWHNASGKVHVFESGSSGWSEVAKLGLQALGLTSSVTGTWGSTYGASEYRTWTRFGYKSCVVSGSYIAAAAQGINEYVGSQYVRQRHSVFILKSGSSGWKLEARIDDPATNLILTASSQNDTSDTEFGTGLALNHRSLLINSPEWQSNWSDSFTTGRSYVYVSSSANGWVLSQTIDNPYSGSAWETAGYAGTNMKMGYNSQGGYPNAGSVGYGSKPAMSGSVLALNAPSFGTHLDTLKYIRGAVIVLEGTASFANETEIKENINTVTQTVLVTSSDPGAPIPFKFASKNATNMRNQTTSSFYKTFVS